MDDSRIKQLTEEVLSQVRGGGEGAELTTLEARVAALEAAVRGLQASVPAGASSAATAVQVQVNPSLQVLRLPAGGSEHCVLEPDKPCVQSGQCRSLGH